MPEMTPDVAEAIAEVRDTFPDNRVEITVEAQGGAYVIVNDVRIGPQYAPEKTWIGFLIPYTYPRADCYPHFVDGDIRRTNAGAMGEAITTVIWRERSAWQISRRSNHWNAETDTAAAKLLKVLDWLRERP